MNNEFFFKVADQYEAFLVPMVKANKLAVVNFEKLVGFQMGALRGYAELGLERMKAASQINDPQSCQAFLNDQLQVAEVVGQKLLDDAKALADLGAGFKADLDALVKESAAILNKATKATVTKAA